jgi:hypothetical protein
MKQDLADAQEKFKDEHKDEIEAVLKWEEEELSKVNDEYGEEEDDEETEKEKKPKEKPVMPVFDEEEFLSKWVEDNPPIFIPDEIEEEKDNDWVISEEEEE